MTVFARLWGRSSAVAGGTAASGVALGEIARLLPDEALQRLHSALDGLAPDDVEERLRSMGPNQVARAARHTILREVVGRSPLERAPPRAGGGVLLPGRSAGRDRDRRDGPAQRLARLPPGALLEQGRGRPATHGPDQGDAASARSGHARACRHTDRADRPWRHRPGCPPAT